MKKINNAIKHDRIIANASVELIQLIDLALVQQKVDTR